MTNLAILACYAHPDDEQGVTGTLRLCIDNHIRTGLICATRGEVGEIADPSLATPETLGEVREQELRRAAEIVGIPEVYFLDYRDSGMVDTPPNKDPRAFINANDDEAIGRIVKIIRQFKPTVILTFDETGGYGHPDHLAMYRWATEAFHKAGDSSCYPDAGPAFQPSRLYYSSFPRSRMKQMMEFFKDNPDVNPAFRNIPIDRFGMDDAKITNHVDVSKYVDMKREALQSHRTQMNPNSPFAKIPPEKMREMAATEHFAFAAGVPLPENADPGDLFTGLR